jgi:hypothetical protein
MWERHMVKYGYISEIRHNVLGRGQMRRSYRLRTRIKVGSRNFDQFAVLEKLEIFSMRVAK